MKAVAEAERATWPEHVELFAGKGPIGVGADSRPGSGRDLWHHNLWMSHSYVLELASRGRARISILDWGGNLGQFYLGARAALQGVEIEYEVKDVPAICELGRALQPSVVFHDDEDCLEQSYHLVIASNALQYSEDWRANLSRLGGAATEYLYLTRVPTVFRHASFVTLQRAYAYGYDTEYLGWFFNRDELLAAASDARLTLVREFLVGPHPRVRGAPEQADVRGFLFRPPQGNGRA